MAVTGSVDFFKLEYNLLKGKESSNLKIKCCNQKVCKKKYQILSWVYGEDRKICHSAGLVMPISDPRDRFFYPHHTLMKDTYNLSCKEEPDLIECT